MDQEAACYNALLEKCCSLSMDLPLARVIGFVNNKDRFRELHTQHQAVAFPQDPIEGKLLVNMSAFGSGQSLRSPHLWLLQQQIHSVCCTLLQKPQYSAISTAPHLSARKRPEWSKICVLLQTWEDEELQIFENKVAPDCHIGTLIFDAALVRYPSNMSVEPMLELANDKEHV